jgi:hypothetical protein
MPNVYDIAILYASTLRHDKGQANGKLYELKSIFTKAAKAKWAPLHKEAPNIQRKVPQSLFLLLIVHKKAE